jgi:hypothetical protein
VLYLWHTNIYNTLKVNTSTTELPWTKSSWRILSNKVKVTLRLTVSQSVSLGVEPHLGLMTRYLLLFDSYGIVFLGRPLWRKGSLAFVYAVGPRQRSLYGVRLPWDSWPYFTVSDLRLPFSSPHTTRRVMVEVFEPASKQVPLQQSQSQSQSQSYVTDGSVGQSVLE